MLERRVQQIRETRRRCGFGAVGEQLPGLIADIHSSIAAGREVKALVELAVGVHVHVTLMWLRDSGASVDLRWQAAALAQDLAERLGEVTSLGVAAFGSANALLASGAFELAEAELASLTLPPTNADTAGMIGMVTMTRSLIAAADKRPGDIAALMHAAKELATQFGEPDDRDRLGFGFGPTNVGLWEMALALETGEPDRAVSVARSIQPERHPFKTRQSQYWMDYGRALARVFVPTGIPWQKAEREVSPAEDRYLMTVIATASNPRFFTSRVDVDRRAPTVTVDTLTDLRTRFPDDELYFITGADALAQILSWKRVDELFELAHLVGVTRPGFPLDGKHLPGRAVSLVEVPAMAISSTDCRQHVAHGLPRRPRFGSEWHSTRRSEPPFGSEWRWAVADHAG